MERDSYSHAPNNPMPRGFKGPDNDDAKVVMQTRRNSYHTMDNDDDELVDVTEDN